MVRRVVERETSWYNGRGGRLTGRSDPANRVGRARHGGTARRRRERGLSLTIRSIAEVGTLEGSQRGPSRPAVPSGTVGGTDPNAAGTAGQKARRTRGDQQIPQP